MQQAPGETRRRALLVGVLLVGTLIACGDDDKVSAPSVTPTSRTDEQASATTTPPTTPPTTWPTTTTVPGPWTTLPDPGPVAVPLLLPAGAAPRVLDRICLESTGDGVKELEFWDLTDFFSEFLGITLETQDCDTWLRVHQTATRTSAEYRGLGTCWTGYELNSTTVLEIDGVPVAQWEGSRSHVPYYTTSDECASQFDPTPSSLSAALRLPLEESFGPEVSALFCLAYGPEGICYSTPAFPESVQPLIRWLASGDLDSEASQRMLSTLLWSPRSELRHLRPLVPYLIARLAEDLSTADEWANLDGFSSRWSALELLRNVTGQTLSSPEEYWEWWQSTQG